MKTLWFPNPPTERRQCFTIAASPPSSTHACFSLVSNLLGLGERLWQPHSGCFHLILFYCRYISISGHQYFHELSELFHLNCTPLPNWIHESAPAYLTAVKWDVDPAKDQLFIYSHSLLSRELLLYIPQTWGRMRDTQLSGLLLSWSPGTSNRVASTIKSQFLLERFRHQFKTSIQPLNHQL